MLIITDSNLHSRVPESQFHILKYKLFRKDCNKNGGSLTCYIKQNLPRKVMSYKFPPNLEVFATEKTLGKRKIWTL